MSSVRDYPTNGTLKTVISYVSLSFQTLPDRACNTYMFQADHHSICTQKSEDNLPNDYRPVALMSAAMKCFERLVMAHINSILPDTLDLLQFAYHPNRSTDVAISIALHTSLSYLDKRNKYVKMLFIDYSSAFNTIVRTKLIAKLRTTGQNTSLCNWILDFLTGRPQVVRVGNNTSATLILNTGGPQGCVHSPLLYSLFTHACLAKHDSNIIIMFADNTTVVGLITDNNETTYSKGCQKPGSEVPGQQPLPQREQDKGDYRGLQEKEGRTRRHSHQRGCSGADREFQVPWCPHHQQTTMVQTHQDSREEGTTMPFPPQEKRFGMAPQILKMFYSCTIESILTDYITAWYGNCSASDSKALQRVVYMAQYITGAKLPPIQDLYARWCQRKAQKIVKDSSHPSHRLFSLLPHCKQYRNAKSRSKRLLNSFDPQAIRLLNN
uniref:Reverse transcriptase domain-containing protein n=1 Tax=Salmo trutta TaxID=8032 RepID=A0A673Y8N5_SALTR